MCGELDSSKDQKHGYLVADFSKPEALKIVVENHMKIANPYHILLNNTGGPPGGQAVDAELDEFERAFRAHLMCNHVLVQALVDGMKNRSLWSHHQHHFNFRENSVEWPRSIEHYSWSGCQLEQNVGQRIGSIRHYGE